MRSTKIYWNLKGLSKGRGDFCIICAQTFTLNQEVPRGVFGIFTMKILSSVLNSSQKTKLLPYCFSKTNKQTDGRIISNSRVAFLLQKKTNWISLSLKYLKNLLNWNALVRWIYLFLGIYTRFSCTLIKWCLE